MKPRPRPHSEAESEAEAKEPLWGRIQKLWDRGRGQTLKYKFELALSRLLKFLVLNPEQSKFNNK